MLQGEPIQAVVEARYYYGEPVTQGKVTYAVHRSRYWPPYYLEEDEPPEEEGDQQHSPVGGEQVLEGEGEAACPVTGERYRLSSDGVKLAE